MQLRALSMANFDPSYGAHRRARIVRDFSS
jgi:hypothetical protein